MSDKNLGDLNKVELISKVKHLENEMEIIQEDSMEEKKDERYRLYLSSSETTKRLKKRINFKFAIQALISIGILCGSIFMVSQTKMDLVVPGLLLFIFGLVYYHQIMKNHVINTLGACEIVIKKEK